MVLLFFWIFLGLARLSVGDDLMARKELCFPSQVEVFVLFCVWNRGLSWFDCCARKVLLSFVLGSALFLLHVFLTGVNIHRCGLIGLF
jgi:hypothetical protein